MRLVGLALLSAAAISTPNLAEGPTRAHAAESARSESQAVTIEVHATYGPGGSTRPPEVIAGEVLSFLLSVSNLRVAPTHEVQCSLQGELLDPTGNVLSRTPERPLSGTPWLGGAKLVQNLDWSISRDFPPGSYQFRFRVRDSQGAELADRTLTVRVKPHSTFGAANIRLTHDPNRNQPATGVFAEGTELNVWFVLVGFDASRERAWVESKVSAVDSTDKTASAQPVTSTLNRVFKDESDRNVAQGGLPTHFELGLTRAGAFRVRVELHDRIGKQSAMYEIPILVVPRP
jgi:hypothetical protein